MTEIGSEAAVRMHHCHQLTEAFKLKTHKNFAETDYGGEFTALLWIL